MFNYQIVEVYGHYEVYIDDEFYCSADNVAEAVREIKAYEKQI